MAKDDKPGKVLNFSLSDKELKSKIDQYISMTESGAIELPSWPDFCRFIGCPGDTLEQVMQQGFELKGAYYDRAIALKKMGTWCEAQLVSNPNWGGKNTVKSMFMLKQGFGGAKKYMDERSNVKTGPTTLNIKFGGNDPRSKKAGK